MTTIKFFSKVVSKFALYVGTSFLLMLTMSSLLSGKFPPPLIEYFHQIQNIGKDFKTKSNESSTRPDFGSSLDAISEHRKQQSTLPQNINDDFELEETGLEKESRSTNHSVLAERRIKELENEVTYYKAKLAQSEWERIQLLQTQNSRESSSRAPASPTLRQ